MFPDPSSLTVNGVANSLPRTESSGRKSIYTNADGTLIKIISHSNPSPDRVRTLVRVEKRLLVTDPASQVTDWDTLAVYIVIDRPVVGFSDAVVDQHIQALKGFLTTANNTKLYIGES